MADVVFMPYNYLLDPAVRDTLYLSLRGAVIIIDEAHNVESVCCEVLLSTPFLLSLSHNETGNVL